MFLLLYELLVIGMFANLSFLMFFFNLGTSDFVEKTKKI